VKSHYTGCSAPVAQGIERAPPEREVVGSIPTRRMPRFGSGIPEPLAGTIHVSPSATSRMVSASWSMSQSV
jgi:hypothetical protein